MNKSKILFFAVIMMPFFAQSNQAGAEKTINKEAQKQVAEKSEMSKQEKEAFLTRLLVKPADQCRSWPLCD